MRVYIKRTQVLEMSAEEMDKFRTLMDDAQSGHIVHYAETKLANGSSFGVHMVTKDEQAELERERLKAQDAKRYGHNNDRY